jgi:hypothetical protein
VIFIMLVCWVGKWVSDDEEPLLRWIFLPRPDPPPSRTDGFLEADLCGFNHVFLVRVPPIPDQPLGPGIRLEPHIQSRAVEYEPG